MTVSCGLLVLLASFEVLELGLSVSFDIVIVPIDILLKFGVSVLIQIKSNPKLTQNCALAYQLKY